MQNSAFDILPASSAIGSVDALQKARSSVKWQKPVQNQEVRLNSQRVKAAIIQRNQQPFSSVTSISNNGGGADALSFPPIYS